MTDAMIIDTVDRLLRAKVDRDLLHRAATGSPPDALWRTLEDLGLPLLLVAEDRGGIGAGADDAAGIVMAAGRHALPLPLAETILAAGLADAHGLTLPAGPLTLVAEPLDLDRDGLVHGTASAVPWGGSATALALAGGRLVLCASAGMRPGRNLAAEPRDDLAWSGVQPLSISDATVPDDTVRAVGALARALQIAGALDLLVDDCVDYAGTRSQFGRAIGAFQAVQQMLAVLAGEAAAARIAASFACAQWGTADFGMATAIAKIRCGQAAGIAMRVAHQVHGAIGFTDEHHLHFLTNRLRAWRDDFGSDHYWAERLGQAAIDARHGGLWSFITAIGTHGNPT